MSAADPRRADVFELVRAADAATPLVQRICEVGVDLLEVSGAGLVLTGGPHDQVRAHCTDALTGELGDLELELGQGPSLHALRTASPVLVDDLTTDPPAWPVYAAHARARGVRALFAFPLRSGSLGYGSFDLYRTRSGPLSTAQLTDARILAEIAASSLATIRHDQRVPAVRWGSWRVAGDGTAPARVWAGPVDATVTLGSALTWPWSGDEPRYAPIPSQLRASRN